MAAVLSRASRIEITIAAIFVAAYLLVLPAALTALCSSPNPYQPITYNLSKNGEAQENNAPNGNKAPIKGATVGKIEATGSAEQKQQTIEKPESWGNRFWCEVKASDWFIGLFTLLLAIATYFLWRETERLAGGADDQADKMERSIKEAARAAAAMEGVSTSIATNVVTTTDMAAMQREFWQRQMRAYVSVIIGGATYQERDKNIKFAGSPRIVNDGMTPAHSVKTVIKASIVRFPIPDSFDFTLPEEKIETAPAMGPRQHRDFTSIVEDYVPDQDILGIKNISGGRCLFCWGRVTYDDAFGNGHFANFAQILYWKSDNSVWGAYERRHNDSD